MHSEQDLDNAGKAPEDAWLKAALLSGLRSRQMLALVCSGEVTPMENSLEGDRRKEPLLVLRLFIPGDW